MWNEISKISSLNMPHLLEGDFNCVISPNHKKGGKASFRGDKVNGIK